jgi:hypothetical protein
MATCNHDNVAAFYNQLLGSWAKRQEDKSLGWRCDEVTTLTLRIKDLSREVRAEIQHLPPAFGFAPQRQRALVRVPVRGICTAPMPERGYSLLWESGQFFGDENGWSVKEVFVDIETGEFAEFLLESA